MWELLFGGSSLAGSLMQGAAGAVGLMGNPNKRYNRVEDPRSTEMFKQIAQQRGQVGQIRNQDIQNTMGSMDKTGSMAVDKMSGTLSNEGENADTSMLSALKTNAKAGGLTPAMSTISGINKNFLSEESNLNDQQTKLIDQIMYFQNEGQGDPAMIAANLLGGEGKALSNLPSNMTNSQGNAKVMRMFQQLLENQKG
jgi:hypothetical protein